MRIKWASWAFPEKAAWVGVLLRCREVLEGWDEVPRVDGRPHWALNLVRDQELFSLWASVCPSVKWEARVHDLQHPSPSCAPIPPSPGPEGTQLGTPFQVSAESRILPHMAISLPTPSSLWGLFCTEVISRLLLLSALPGSPPAPMPPPALCIPRPLRSLVSSAHLTCFLFRGQLRPCPHLGQVPRVGGFHCCGRVTALVGLSGATRLGAAWLGIWQRLCPASVCICPSVASWGLGLFWSLGAT